MFAPVVIGFLAVAALVAIIWAVARYERLRREARLAEMSGLAAKLGFDFMPYGLSETNEGDFWQQLIGQGPGSETTRFLAQFQGFEPFGQGHSNEIAALIVGQQPGRQWLLFDFIYKVTRSNGKSSSTSTYENSVVVARLDVLLPELTIKPQTMWHEIGERFVKNDIHLESDEFNERYFVTGPDQRAVFDLLHPQALELLLSLRGRVWQFAGPYALLHERNGFQSAEWYERAIADLSAFLDTLPGYVRQDRGFAADWPHPRDA